MKSIIWGIVFFIFITIFIPMIIVFSCDISTSNEDRPREKRNLVESDLNISMYNHETNEIMEIELEKYTVGVIAGETPANFEMEALKAQAVAARTYVLWRRSLYKDTGHPDHPGAFVCNNYAHCQEWLSEDELEERHGKSWMKKNLPKLEEAVMSTKGVIMTYNMKPIEPLYHSTSGGRTENSEDVFSAEVPYLRAVSSPYEEKSPVLVDHYEISTKDFIFQLKERYNDFSIDESKISSEIDILERTDGGTIRRIQIGNKEFSGREIRELFGLRSSNFTVDIKFNNIEFTTRGYGHGVGMSQWGANGMAEEGKTFDEILKHYYQGVSLSILKSHKND